MRNVRNSFSSDIFHNIPYLNEVNFDSHPIKFESSVKMLDIILGRNKFN